MGSRSGESREERGGEERQGEETTVLPLVFGFKMFALSHYVPDQTM